MRDSERIAISKDVLKDAATNDILNNKKHSGAWNDDTIQFCRLLAEIRAVGLTDPQMNELCMSMHISWDMLDDLLDRADNAFEKMKERVL